MPELIDGDFVDREPMGQKADEIASNRIRELRNDAKSTLPAVVNGALGSFQIFPDDPSKVRIPDASFTTRDRLAGGVAFKDHCRVVPELVVEVISPDDLASELQAKLIDHASARVPWVLVGDPDSRSVISYLAGGNQWILRLGDTIRGGHVLPGFECPVSGLFQSVSELSRTPVSPSVWGR